MKENKTDLKIERMNKDVGTSKLLVNAKNRQHFPRKNVRAYLLVLHCSFTFPKGIASTTEFYA